ncbi:TRAP transporter small permease subunit [Moritella sp. 36]|uniref:TRAP transporter small permease subunit n=1 Tax=Moritella sp. 36 TaxID=2746233 RepID=UPI001BA8398E|nr:TRAP transporter small permease [Moritella sp. 36]QUM89312.1 TRAP transporter small permease subunit [Moritella sp. 36]
MKYIDAISSLLGQIMGWLFVVIAGMITYEVIARYLFNSPTIWAAELSMCCMIWAIYLGAAYTIQQRGMIRIDILGPWLGPNFILFSDILSLIIIAIFSTIACYYGIQVVTDSIRLSRAASSMLALPMWITEIAIPIGFATLVLQCISEIIRTLKYALSTQQGDNR